MLKKIILATALVATASFATWDKFPVLNTHNGQVKIGEVYGMPSDDDSMDDIYAGVRFTIIQNLELGTIFKYRVFTDNNGVDGPDGIYNLPIMVRYQFMPIMNAFLDVSLPIGEESIGQSDGFGFHFGAQFSQKFGILNFGSELGLLMETRGDDKTTPPWTLNLGVEGDFEVTQLLTPYIGIDLLMYLGKKTIDGDNVGENRTGDLSVAPYLGIVFTFSKMFSLDFSGKFQFGEDFYGYDDVQMYYDLHLNINF
ncbi:transporter [uncultured Fibrobacter sp.]|uniref:transporter n=1 Tax=uncultured Fibrobacter sp. TaxID=261512 RepID=UPI0025FD635F|nr:transporter [uncultured Fibrobacter sp.]